MIKELNKKSLAYGIPGLLIQSVGLFIHPLISLIGTVLLIIGLALFIIPSFCFAETIILKSGKKVEGKILERTDDYVRVEQYGMPITYFLSDIKSIDREKVFLEDISTDHDLETVSVNGIQYISETEIRNFFKKIELACNQKDVNSYIETLADDVKVVMLLGNQKQEFNREEYRENLEIGWKTTKDYNYRFKILSIKILRPKAIVEGKEIEEITFPTGQVFTGESIHKITLEKVD